MKIQEQFYNEIKATVLEIYPEFPEEKIKDIIDGYWRTHKYFMENYRDIRYPKFGRLEFDEEKLLTVRAAKRVVRDNIEKLKESQGSVSNEEMVEEYRKTYTEFMHIKPMENNE